MNHRSTTGLRGLVLLLGVCGSCSEGAQQPAQSANLPSGVVARVGNLDVPDTSVARIAATQKVSARVACERAIADALFASWLSADIGSRPVVAVAERAAHARVLVETMEQRAARAGPPRDDEIERLTRERWLDLDRPEAVRVVHFVVRVMKPEQEERARQLAATLAKEQREVSDPQQFLRQISARSATLKAEGMELRAERLPYVTADGRTFEMDAPVPQEGPRFDETFSKSAHALRAPGEQSGVVKTPFGYHVLLLEERLPEQRTSPEERRTLLHREVLARRAQQEIRELVAELKARTAVELSRAADELTAKVPVAP